jgi:hypothetical protein
MCQRSGGWGIAHGLMPNHKTRSYTNEGAGFDNTAGPWPYRARHETRTGAGEKGPALWAWPYGTHVTSQGGARRDLGLAAQIIVMKWVFIYSIWFFCLLYAYIKWIFSIFGGYWAFLEARFLEEVGDVKPTPMLYKPGLFEAKHSHSE